MGSSSAWIDFLRGQPVIVLFTLLGLGHLLGRVKVGGIAFGPVAGTLLVAIVLGALGLRISAGAEAVGFALFIFSVGYQAGPHFIDVLRAQGLRYFALALFVVGVGFLTAWLAGIVLHLPRGGSVGLFAGGLTSGPALAAAQDALRSGLVKLPADWTTDSALASIGASYAICYVVGLLGTIAATSLLPKIVGVDLSAEARRLERSTEAETVEPLQARAYRVANEEFCRPTIEELGERIWDGLAFVRVRRDLVWLQPGAQQHLRLGDEVHAYGYAKFFRHGIDRLGPEIPILNEMKSATSQTQVVVARASAVGKTLRQLDLARRHGVVVREVKRDGYQIPVTRDLVLQRGDVVTVLGPVWGIRELPDTLGPVEPNPVETDMTTFAFGVAIGAVLGLLSLTVGGIPFSLGAAGGLLLSGVLVGWLNAARPMVGRFPEAARWILMEFGLLIFIAGVGLNAGGSIVQTLRDTGLALVLGAILVVTLPFALGYAFGRKGLKLEPVILLGALTGAMTAGAALSLVTREAHSSVPALGYTGTYALASILMTLGGTLLMHAA